MTRGLGLALALIPAAAPAAGDIALTMPLDCALGETCFIQQFVDRDPGPGAQDFACGSLSYDGHQGTDFALNSRASMRAGVSVLAAAPGRVAGVRDEMPDIASNAPDAPALDGRDCGNGVLLDHGDGWLTQYCHMRRGSIAVAMGEDVSRGARLGDVGLSGHTEFPHLHLTVRQDGAVVDPFAPDREAACGTEGGETLWQDAPEYVPGGLVASGFSTSVPEYARIRDGLDSPDRLGREAPALVLWGFAFGGRAGDAVAIRITGPGGTVVDHDETLPRDQAQYFRAAGRRQNSPQGWPAGVYEGVVELLRDGEVYSHRAIALQIGD